MERDHGQSGAAWARQRGFALLGVLWLVVLLAVIASSFGATVRTEVQLGRNAVEKAKAESLADAGVHRAILSLLDTDSPTRWRTDGAIYSLAFEGGEVQVAIQDEAGKIDLNMASEELLRGLFIAVGLDQDDASTLADAIADFRDPDDLRSLRGAESPDYFAAGLSHGAKDAPLQSVEELQQVLGMTAEVYRRVAPLVTVHTWEDGIDPLVAPPEVLLAVPGITPAEVEAILAAREELHTNVLVEGAPADEEEWVGDGVDPYGSVAALLEGLEEFTSAVGGWVYSVRADARTDAGGRFVRVAVVALDMATAPYSFYEWKRGEARPPAGDF